MNFLRDERIIKFKQSLMEGNGVFWKNFDYLIEEKEIFIMFHIYDAKHQTVKNIYDYFCKKLFESEIDKTVKFIPRDWWSVSLNLNGEYIDSIFPKEVEEDRWVGDSLTFPYHLEKKINHIINLHIVNVISTTMEIEGDDILLIKLKLKIEQSNIEDTINKFLHSVKISLKQTNQDFIPLVVIENTSGEIKPFLEESS